MGRFLQASEAGWKTALKDPQFAAKVVADVIEEEDNNEYLENK